MTGLWHTITFLSEWSFVLLGVLGALGFVVYIDPKFLRVAVTIALIAVGDYGFLLYGNHSGRVDGEAILQRRWDKEKAATAKARSAELARQASAAELQKAADDTLSALLTKQTDDALAQIAAQADGRKALLESWQHTRALRGIQ